MSDALIDRGWWVKGVTAGRGVIVACPRYIAFVPTERPKHLGVELAWGVAGFVEIGVIKVPPERVIAELTRGPLDAEVDRLTSGLSGRKWPAASVSVLEKKFLFRGKKRGLWFNNGGESIRFNRVRTEDELAQARALLSSWSWSR